MSALTVDARGHLVPHPPAGIAAESAYVDYPGRWRGRWDRLVAPYGHFARGAFARRLTELSAAADVVHVSGIAGGTLLPLIQAPSIVQIDNLTRLDRDMSPLWTRQGRIDRETLRAERRTCRRARHLLTNSRTVARELARDVPHAVVRHAPLSLNPDDYAPLATVTEPVAGLIGTATWPPTANAVTRLLTRVWPLVLERRPSAQLRLAGRGMTQAHFPKLPVLPGVRWIGEVPSAEGFLRDLGLLVYPLERGSGTKIKVLESMILGLPVVTTPLGAEGILGVEGADGAPARGIVVRLGDDALAEATGDLLSNPAARRESGRGVRAQFETHHAPARTARDVIEIYRELLD